MFNDSSRFIVMLDVYVMVNRKAHFWSAFSSAISGRCNPPPLTAAEVAAAGGGGEKLRGHIQYRQQTEP